ncbi:MAG: UDP-2,3-diacylglucosamine diphosphatase [Alteromonadaceae bacterium]|nr:UDP-2,3-diacylglucosamine diphosphatase [Alteromonadaceae bacterium]
MRYNVKTTHHKAIFISDVHLGSTDCKAELLLEFLHHNTCDVLYLVGDIVDLWAMQRQFKWPESHNAIFHKIIQLSHECKVIYLPGNHDAPLQKYDGLAIGDIQVVRETVHVTQQDKRFLVLHGDQFDDDVTLGKFEAWIGDKGYDLLLWVNRTYNRYRSLNKAPYRSLAGYIKSRIKGAQRAISRYQVASTKYAAEKNVDGVICGHIHHPEQVTTEHGIYINDGDWVENCTALCESMTGELQLVDWVETRDKALSKLHLRVA